MDGTTTVSTGEEVGPSPPVDAGAGLHSTDDDAEAEFDALVAGSQRSILRAVALIVGDGDRALDVVQDAFGRAYASWRKVRRMDVPAAWVRRVAIRQAVKVAGRERRRPELEVVAVGRAGDGSPAVADVDQHVDVVAALSVLPPQQRAAVVLHHLEDRPVAEVAELLGCSPSTAKVHLHRGRQALRPLLGGLVGDDDGGDEEEADHGR